MQCTPEQIEQKRRLAQAKLAQKLKSPAKSFYEPTTSNPVQSFQSPGRSGLSINNSVASNGSPKFVPKQYQKPYHKPYERSNSEPQNHTGKENTVKLSCSLVSEDRFVVDMPSFSNQCVETFKLIPSKNYDPNTRQWTFHVKDYNLFMTKLNMLQPKVIVERLPNYVLNLMKKPKSDYSKIDLNKIDPVLAATLMSFQQEGVCFGIDKKGRCLIADDMGLGKTFQALAIASYYQEDWPLLIVTTATMKNVWEETIHNYLPSVPIMYTQYMETSKDYIGDSRVLIVSHDLMARSSERLLERRFGVLIIDESHNLKNFKAKCTKAATVLARQAKRVILLSGTPALSRPSELFTQLSLLDEHFFGNFFDYSKRYCDGKTTNFGWDASGKSNLQELEIVLARKFMIRRTKEEVLQSMPNKRQEIVKLDVKLEQFSQVDRDCLNALALKFSSGTKGSAKHAALLVFFSQTAKIKIPSVCSYILQILESSEKFLVFAHHQVMLDAIENILKQKNKKFIRIDGNTTTDQRKYFMDKFQSDESYKCAILSTTAANAGITLTAAQLVIFAELHWNPSILSQAESRAHRIGQKSVVTVRYLLAPGTADDHIWPMLQEKQRVLGEVGLCNGSLDSATITRQRMTKNDGVTEGLHFTQHSNREFGGDIRKFMTSGSASDRDNGVSDDTCQGGSKMDVFNDGFDDILSSMDFN